MWFWIVLLVLGFAVVAAMQHRQRRGRSADDLPGKSHESPNAADSSNSGWGV